jgi:hypothetical protein
MYVEPDILSILHKKGFLGLLRLDGVQHKTSAALRRSSMIAGASALVG